MVGEILGGVVVTGATVFEVDGSRVHFVIITIPLKIIVKVCILCRIYIALTLNNPDAPSRNQLLPSIHPHTITIPVLCHE